MSKDPSPDGRGTWICLPTYNEAENLLPIATAILQVLPAAHILVVDDNSPDGTGERADDFASRDPRLEVLHRPHKEGLGRAYVAGFSELLARSDVERIIQMDADGSHPVAVLPTMLSALAEADLVIGSRYVPGGGVENWGLLRRFISRFGSVYARAWLQLPIQDPTGGFKAWRADCLRQVLERDLTTSGYVFQVETSYAAHRLGASLCEVPITFTDRRVGQSKMTAAIAMEAAWRVPAMRWAD